MPILNSPNLKDATNQLNSEILRTIHKIAAKQVKKITSRIGKPWYDVDLKCQRQIVKNRDTKWFKYKEQFHWKAYKRERNRFITRLKYKKEIMYTRRKVQPQETARNYINSLPNYLGKISPTHYLHQHPVKDWQKNLQITSLKKSST